MQKYQISVNQITSSNNKLIILLLIPSVTGDHLTLCNKNPPDSVEPYFYGSFMEAEGQNSQYRLSQSCVTISFKCSLNSNSTREDFYVSSFFKDFLQRITMEQKNYRSF